MHDGRSYGWETCLYWFEKAPRQWRNQSHPHHQGDGRNDERRTPPAMIFQRYGASCTLDVAATDDNTLCPNFFTKKQNALKQRWHGMARHG